MFSFRSTTYSFGAVPAHSCLNARFFMAKIWHHVVTIYIRNMQERVWKPNGNMKNDDVRSKPEVAPRLCHQKLRLLVCSDLLYLN